MATSPLKSGTRNGSLNAPVEWFRIVAGEAYGLGIAQQELFKRAVEEFLKVEKPEIARRLREIRNGLVALALLFSMGGQWVAHRTEDLARVKTFKVRSAKKQKCEEDDWFFGWEVA